MCVSFCVLSRIKDIYIYAHKWIFLNFLDLGVCVCVYIYMYIIPFLIFLNTWAAFHDLHIWKKLLELKSKKRFKTVHLLWDLNQILRLKLVKIIQILSAIQCLIVMQKMFPFSSLSLPHLQVLLIRERNAFLWDRKLFTFCFLSHKWTPLPSPIRKKLHILILQKHTYLLVYTFLFSSQIYIWIYEK